MCQLVETIKVFNKKLYNIDFHNRRFNETRKKLFNLNERLDLKEIIQIPNGINDGLYKCRVLYNNKIDKIEFIKYEKKIIRSLKVVEDDEIDYSFKYVDRANLMRLFERRDGCDDILIIKNSCVTDTLYCNVLFYDGQNWVTPNTPLLKGIQRDFLLTYDRIKEKKIEKSDIKLYKKVRLINCLIDFNEKMDINIENIRF